MTSPNLLFIEPQGKATDSPLIDDLTRRMTAAYRVAEPGSRMFFGVHTCVCGASSEARNYSLPDRRTTNSLCVHYLAHHRPDVPAEQLARVASLTYGMAEPSEEELRGGRWRGNRPGDFFGRELVAAFAHGGLDLTDAYLESEGTPQERAYYHHVLGNIASMPIKAVPALVDAIRQTEGGVDRWMASAFWPEGWKEAWIAPLLTVLRADDRDIRLWAVDSLGNLGDTVGTWHNLVFVNDNPDVEVVRATGIPGSQGREVGRALLEVMLRDTDGKVRSAALRAIGRLGASGEAAVPALVRIMRRSRHVEQRMAAIRALRNIDPLTPKPAWMPQSVSILTAVLKGESKEMRRSAVSALLHLGPEGCRLALTALQEALADEDPSVRSTSNAAIRLTSLEP